MVKLLLFTIFSFLSANINATNQNKYVNYKQNKLFDEYPEHGNTWIYFPDGNGKPRVVYLNDTVDSLRKNHNKDIEFHLYTRLNPKKSKILIPFDQKSIIKSNFNTARPTKIIAHGWKSSYKSNLSQTIKNNYLKDADYNIILVNWKKISSNNVYPAAARDTKMVGSYVGLMIDTLIESKAKLKDIHLIGHSLGAHVVGNAGQAVTKGKVYRITGLDPALPEFEYAPNNQALDSSDAEFVDVIHTCGGVLGYYYALGHVDFYPNGGISSQPGCLGATESSESCSHLRAWKYFAESILNKNGFMSVRCIDLYDFLKGNCVNNRRAPMGDAVTPKAKGTYYLRTKSKSPFARYIDFGRHT